MTELELYKSVMESLASGKAVGERRFAAAVAFAKANKRKRPVRPEGSAEPKGAKTANTGVECCEDGCDLPAMAKQRCSKHYTAWRRTDPDVMAKAREASKRYAERKRAEQTPESA